MKVYLKNLYDENTIAASVQRQRKRVEVYLRRFVRLIALPYCYFVLIDWEQCTASRLKVIRDLIFIFFRLRYFPDNYSACRLWERAREEWIFYYGSIYDPFQRYRLRKEVQREEYQIAFEDKEICYVLCKVSCLPLPKQFCCLDPADNLVEIIRNIFSTSGVNKIIIKPVRGIGGKGIATVFRKNSEIGVLQHGKYGDFVESGLNEYRLSTRSVVQEFVEQDERLSRFHPHSLNTVRIATLLTREKKVLFLGALIRVGVGSACIDNTSAGGIGIGIDLASGRLFEKGYTQNGKIFTRHPESGLAFENVQVPLWEQVKEVAVRTQLAFPFYKLLGLDIGIGKMGPVLIEINAAHDNVGLEQKSGPILKNRDVVAAFSEYDLLINRYQRALKQR